MRFAGIIAEYDPFHNGHAWQLAQARALGARQVAVAMSCSLTQRGAVPLLPEAVRVQAALRCGADFIFALPAPCACAGAEAFARAGVRLLAAAGCDALVFGAETPDTALLMDAARVLASEEYRAALKAQLAAGARSFAAARQAAVETLRPGSALAALLDQPNNNLAVEYCKAILELDVPLTPIPLPRQGANHGEALNGNVQFASASALRALWTQQGVEALRPYVPEAVFPLYQEAAAAGSSTDFSAAGRCELALLRARCTGETPFAKVRGVSEGLEHRLEKSRPGQHHTGRAAEHPDHDPLPPRPDAAAGHGRRPWLHRRSIPRPAALSPSAGGPPGAAGPAETGRPPRLPLPDALTGGKCRLRPDGTGPAHRQRFCGALPCKTAAHGRRTSSKNYLLTI